MRLMLIFGFLALAEAVPVIPDIGLGYRIEPGVEEKGAVAGGIKIRFKNNAAVDAGVYGNIGDNFGLGGYALKGEFGCASVPWLNLHLGVQHQEWRDWRCGENRAFFLLHLTGLKRFEVGMGVAWRQGVFDRARFREPWVFTGPAGEWNILYRLEGLVLETARGELGLFLSNISRHQIHNPQMFPFGVRAGYQVVPHWRLAATCQSTVKGFSALLFSPGEFEIELGVRYEK
ncbi:MAG: hypothetical protein K6T77_03215 [candidate division WOR-3 bacterium]|jgi:hypothetical protein|nr:hypothetical protein [candidate division WOR-3 bacterium]MCR4424181.1 hypothetical protein [candidate division WOR-3 bacterium]MDH7519400.1 hypothetical protein [bacterium]